MTLEDAIKKCTNKEAVWYTDNDGEDHEVRINSITQRREVIISFYGKEKSLCVDLSELEYAL